MLLLSGVHRIPLKIAAKEGQNTVKQEMSKGILKSCYKTDNKGPTKYNTRSFSHKSFNHKNNLVPHIKPNEQSSELQ